MNIYNTRRIISRDKIEIMIRSLKLFIYLKI